MSTPFEQFNISHKKTEVFRLAMLATDEMVTILRESELMAEINDGFAPSDVKSQAKQDAAMATKTLATIAQVMESEFGISA
jgi:hypothetical protein